MYVMTLTNRRRSALVGEAAARLGGDVPAVDLDAGGRQEEHAGRDPLDGPVEAEDQPGGPQEPAAASGMLELAQRLHNEHVANGKAEGERIIAEARSTGEQIVREAEDQRNRTLAQLEKERSGLEHKIDELRRFEADYRTRLKSYLHNLLNTVEDASESQAPAL